MRNAHKYNHNSINTFSQTMCVYLNLKDFPSKKVFKGSFKTKIPMFIFEIRRNIIMIKIIMLIIMMIRDLATWTNNLTTILSIVPSSFDLLW